MNHLTERFRMSLLALGSAATLLLGPVTAAFAHDEPPAAAAPAELVRAISALRLIATLRADFTQTDSNGQRVGGVLTLKRPGMIRFQYAPGVPMLIIADGHALTMIDTEVHQIQRWPIRNSPLGALLDPGRDVTRYGSLQPTGDPGVLGVEVRDRSHPEYGVITLYFTRKPAAPGGLELAGWVSFDSQGKRTLIRLSNQQYGLAVSDELFRYTDIRARPHH